MKNLRQYIRKVILESMEINNPEIQKLLSQVRQASSMDSETVGQFMELLSILMETELNPEEIKIVNEEIKGLIVQGYAKGENFENVRSALKMGSSLGFHASPIRDPITPGGFGFKTGASEIVFSSPTEAQQYVNFLKSIGVPGGAAGYKDETGKSVRGYTGEGRSGDSFYLYPPHHGAKAESSVRIWNG